MFLDFVVSDDVFVYRTSGTLVVIGVTACAIMSTPFSRDCSSSLATRLPMILFNYLKNLSCTLWLSADADRHDHSDQCERALGELDHVRQRPCPRPCCQHRLTHPVTTTMSHIDTDLSPTSPAEESDPNLSPVTDLTEPRPGLNGTPVRCTLCFPASIDIQF